MKTHKSWTFILCQSKDDEKAADPSYTPLAAEKKQKKFEDNETMMHVAVI